MTSGDAHNELLISAYLDGELTPEEQQYVERLLATSDEYRQLLDDLRVLASQLRELPRSALDAGFAERIVDRTKDLVQDTPDAYSPAEIDLGLLSAYLDGELSADELEVVQGSLATDDRSREHLEELRGLEAALRELPTYALDSDFAARVLHHAERSGQTPQSLEAESADDAGPLVEPARSASLEPARGAWRGVVWSLAAVAAALLLAFVFGRRPDSGPDDLASGPQPKPSPDTTLRPDETPETSGEFPDLVEPDETTPPEERAPDEARQLLVAMQQKAKRRLILVYEVSVNSWGTQNGAFPKLLARHKIGFRDTFPVGEEEQRSMLKGRYLENAEIAPADKEGMDELRLYLVSCTANQADAMYVDLAGAPPGFASFSLNLTAGDAGGGVLNRVCEASEIEERASEAVRLVANFAILSRTARNLGAFGKIEWIDPEVLTPPAGSESGDSSAPADTEEQDEDEQRRKLQSGEFQCELLFVVRHLQPVEE